LKEKVKKRGKERKKEIKDVSYVGIKRDKDKETERKKGVDN